MRQTISTLIQLNQLFEHSSKSLLTTVGVTGKEKVEVAGQFFKRVVHILNEEEVEFDKKVVAELVQKHFPDFRRVINELQRYSVSGKIDSGVLVNVGAESFKQLYNIMKDKNFSEVRKWASANSDGDTVRIFRELYDHSNTFLQPSSIPQLVLILADYQYKASFVADHELNLVACLTEIMGECKFL